MSDTVDTTELKLRERELRLKEDELAHRREMDQRGARYQLSPWTTALIALLSTALTAAFSGLLSQRADAEKARRDLALREREQQFQIVLKATENATPEVAAKNLLFFVDIGYLPDPDSAIRRKARGGEVPTIASDGRIANPLAERVQQAQSLGAGPATRVAGIPFTLRDHVLLKEDGKPVAVVVTPNVGRNNDPRVIVLHHTATRTAAQAISILRSGITSGSAHLLIDRDGSITQLAPFDYATFHAGRGEWRGMRLNSHSIGIELVNAGELRQENGAWKDALGTGEIPAGEVVRPAGTPEGRAWQGYTEPQIQTLERLIRLLRAGYPSITEVVTHGEVDPRKAEPGPAFPLDRVKRAVTEN